MDPVDLILRWAHILPAVVLAGGILFQWLSATAEDSDEERTETVRRKWSKVVMACAGLLLVSGLANTGRAAMAYDLPLHYNLVLLVKILLALGVFYLASLLAGRSETAKKFQANRAKWLKVTGMLLIAIVLLGGVMKVSDHPPKIDDDSSSTEADP